MKRFNFLAVWAIVMVGIAFTSCDSKNAFSSAKLKSDIDSVSFLVGQSYGAGYKKQFESMMDSWPIKGEIEAFIAGFTEGLRHPDDTVFFGRNMQETQDYVNDFFNSAVEKAGEVNKAEAEKFLAENKTKSGVITTLSGLQYQVITEGTGPKPKEEDMVRVHYTGKYLDGSTFDSSVDRGQPAEMPVGGVIPGFSEGLQLMPVGSKYIIWIPVDLGYGTSNQRIKPNSALVFELELLEILPAQGQ